MKNIDYKREILKEIKKNLNFCDKILVMLFKNYTFKILQQGAKIEYNWNSNKNLGKIEKIKKSESKV